VGWALHVLPAHGDVPWHRVVDKEGRIHFDEGSGQAALQRALLAREGVEFDKEGRIDMARFCWQPHAEGR